MFASINWVSEEYGITHYKKMIAYTCNRTRSSTSDRHKWPSICIPLDYRLNRVVPKQTQNIAGGKISGFKKKNRLHVNILRIQKFSDSKFSL